MLGGRYLTGAVNRWTVTGAVVAVLGLGVGTVAVLDAQPARHGALNPAVTQATIGVTICVPGWTATVRPPTSYTTPVKRALWVKAGSHGTLSDYELDHWVPLEIGGAPSDPKNLVLQPFAGSDGAHAKDVVENRVHREVCAGTITLAVGEQCFMIDWKKCP